MHDNDFDDVFRPFFDLGRFRWTAARYIKHLIRARWKCEPDFISVDQLVRWKLENISKDSLLAHELVRLAAQDLAYLFTA